METVGQKQKHKKEGKVGRISSAQRGYSCAYEEDEETWSELPDLLLEEIYILLANRWRNYCSQVCTVIQALLNSKNLIAFL